MILDPTSVGELVRSLAVGGANGGVKRIFRSSAYLDAKEGLILLLRGELRSPMTINLGAGPELLGKLTVGQAFDLRPTALRLGETEIRLDRATTFRSSLLNARPADPIAEDEVVRGATTLKLLYSASEAALGLVKGQAFGEFARAALRPATKGRLDQLHRFSSYSGLIGSGSGFTPAGDDLVAGFTAAFNRFAMGAGAVKISLPLAELRKRTVSESASLVDYAQRGYVDEGLERLILAGLGNDPQQFRGQIIGLADRGHTSGLDMSLGVLLSIAVINDYTRHGRALETSLAALIS